MRHRLLGILLFVGFILLTYFGVEAGSFSCLWLMRVSNIASTARLNTAREATAYQRSRSSYYREYFDPVMGFRSLEGLGWFDARPDGKREFIRLGAAHHRFDAVKLKELALRAKGHRVVVTFGGSTTAGPENWPRYLAEQIGKDWIVVNAGQNGYSSFLEKLLYSSWVEGAFRWHGIPIDLVLTMDGVNDIAYGLAGHQESLKAGRSWLANYHAYHQQMDRDVAALHRHPSTVVKLFLETTFHSLFRRSPVSFARKYFPQTMLLVSTVRSESAPQLQRLEVSDDTTRRILQSFESNLLDFSGAAQSRGTRFHAFLQPVMLQAYGSYPRDRIHDFSTVLSVMYRSGLPLGGRYRVDMDILYGAAERMYLGLEKQHPHIFHNVARAFSKTSDGSYYENDGIHYTAIGSRRLAQEVLSRLRERGVLDLPLGADDSRMQAQG